MGLPLPTFTFTIPSVHDDTILNCRLYLPWNHLSSAHLGRQPFEAAIIAHPYAPFGGCYDDPVVEATGSVLLEAGCMIGTFNFRGASDSPGHTSWSAKPELGDYVSFYGFMLDYLDALLPEKLFGSQSSHEQLPSTPSAGRDGQSLSVPMYLPRLILAGYSYGALIVSHLPEVHHVQRLFANGAEGSAVAEIRLRALRLSLQTLQDLKTKKDRQGSPANLQPPGHGSDLALGNLSSSILVGGFESQVTEHRIGHESRTSIDMRRSLDRVREKMHSKVSSPRKSSEQLDDGDKGDCRCGLVGAQICYLLISPVLSPAAAFATLFSRLSFVPSSGQKSSPSQETHHDLVRCPSLALYGNKDFFTAVKKLRAWANELDRAPDSRFQHHEFEGAGHFWREPGVLTQMTEYVGAWHLSLEAVRAPGKHSSPFSVRSS